MARDLDLQHYIGHLIRRAEQVHTALWSRHVSRDITSQQFAVLNTLSRKADIDQRTLARLTSLDRSTINVIVRRLSDQHYLSQVRDEDDRRRTLLRLTDAGAALLASLIPPARRDQRTAPGLPPRRAAACHRRGPPPHRAHGRRDHSRRSVDGSWGPEPTIW
ncbi:MarR family winged helix-turn-helix transcriptional regulator [Streptomyces sp. NPDC005373]|uniref:MarR family winged helix-turn-helix transcriptional regulator n=1 Tax=Streptomyces sp. NPDC005373 TaxID=3156879 RepID=UPI0033A4B345